MGLDSFILQPIFGIFKGPWILSYRSRKYITAHRQQIELFHSRYLFPTNKADSNFSTIKNSHTNHNILALIIPLQGGTAIIFTRSRWAKDSKKTQSLFMSNNLRVNIWHHFIISIIFYYFPAGIFSTRTNINISVFSCYWQEGSGAHDYCSWIYGYCIRRIDQENTWQSLQSQWWSHSCSS